MYKSLKSISIRSFSFVSLLTLLSACEFGVVQVGYYQVNPPEPEKDRSQLAINFDQLSTLASGPGSGVNWMVQGNTYNLSWTLNNPEEVYVNWVCDIESVNLKTTDVNYIASGTSCKDFSSFVSFTSSKTGYSFQFTPSTSIRGIFRITLQVTNGNGKVDKTKISYFGVRENWVTANLVAAFDANFASAETGENGEVLPVPAATGCYDLDWYDLSGNGNTGELISYNACSSNRGWTGDGTTASPYSLAMDGTDNGHVEVLNPTNLDAPVGGSFTMEMLVQINTYALHHAFFHKWSWTDGTGPKGFTMQTLDNDVYPKMVLPNGGSSRTISGTTAMPLSTWFHMVMTFDDSTNAYNIYLNSDTPSSGTLTAVLKNAPTTKLFIGRRTETGTQGLLNGKIMRAAIYNTALTHTQVRQNCNALKTRLSSLTCN